MTTARMTAAYWDTVPACYRPDCGGAALPGVVAAMIDEYAPTLGEQVVRVEFERCQRDLAGVSPASLPEMAYRLAQQRLTDLVASAPNPDEVHMSSTTDPAGDYCSKN